MIIKSIMKKTMEVINRTERVRNFICSNCKGLSGNIILADSELVDIMNILMETDSEVFFNREADNYTFVKYDLIVMRYVSEIVKYFSDIKDKSIPCAKVDEKIRRISKTYISRVAKILNMDAEEYVMGMLRNVTINL